MKAGNIERYDVKFLIKHKGQIWENISLKRKGKRRNQSTIRIQNKKIRKKKIILI